MESVLPSSAYAILIGIACGAVATFVHRGLGIVCLIAVAAVSLGAHDHLPEWISGFRQPLALGTLGGVVLGFLWVAR